MHACDSFYCLTHTNTAIEVDDVTVGITATAVFFCNVTGLTDTESDLIEYEWQQTQNGAFLATSFPSVIFGRRATGVFTSTLMITNVEQVDDTFNYTCKISSVGGAVVGHATGTLVIIGTYISYVYAVYS